MSLLRPDAIKQHKPNQTRKEHLWEGWPDFNFNRFVAESLLQYCYNEIQEGAISDGSW